MEHDVDPLEPELHAEVGEPAPVTEKAGESVYVIQVAQEIDLEPDDTYIAWLDVTTVTVPLRAKRGPLIKAALEDVNLNLEGDVRVRALDVASAQEYPATVGPTQPPRRSVTVG